MLFEEIIWKNRCKFCMFCMRKDVKTDYQASEKSSGKERYLGEI